MNRLALASCFDDAPTLSGEPIDGPATDPLDPSSRVTAAADAAGEREAPLAIDLPTLARFKAMMTAQGWRVETARMIFDRVYAHQRLAWAHGSADEVLRGLALDMFRRLHAQDGQLPAGRH